MDYWESIVQEVLHKGDRDYKFKFTDIGRAICRDRSRKPRYQREVSNHKKLPMYFLGDSYDGVYFTKRETETLSFLLQGKTIPETGRMLKLSARTIEFYVKNMKLKVGAKTKVELLEKVRTTEIMDYVRPGYDLNFDECESC